MMVEEQKIKTRFDYGLKESDFVTDLTKDSEKEWLPVNDDYNSVLENPINQVLGSFKREFIKNELTSATLFQQLNEDLAEFSKKMSDYPWYENMQIVKLMNNIILKYTNWAASMRQTIFLAKEKMHEVYRALEKFYIKKSEFEVLKDEAAEAISSLEREIKGKIKEKSFRSRISKLNGKIYLRDVPKDFYNSVKENDFLIVLRE